MADNELLRARQEIADDVNELIHLHLAESKPVRHLSPPGGENVLQLMEDSNGYQYVIRAFTPIAVENMANRARMTFTEAWEEMHDIFDDVGIRIVPSHLLETTGEYPFTVVSAYLSEGQDLIDAPTEAKVQLARSLANLLKPGRFIPSREMFNQGAFMVSPDENGASTAFLVDVDPRIIPRFTVGSIDELYIRKFGELFWDHWCREDERQEVISALVMEISKVRDMLGEDTDPFSPAARAFMDVHFMSNGVDMREHRSTHRP
jgi:hypothetical protein